jgi:hypothetical protein
MAAFMSPSNFGQEKLRREEEHQADVQRKFQQQKSAVAKFQEDKDRRQKEEDDKRKADLAQGTICRVLPCLL